MKRSFRLALVLITLGLLAGCVRPGPTSEPWMLSPLQSGTSAVQPTPFQPALTYLPPTRQPGSPVQSPTPDTPHALPTLRPNEESYIVQPSDTLGTIAQKYGVDADTLAAVNKIENPNLLSVGQSLTIPAPEPQSTGADFKILPDSELIYGPASALFDIAAFVQAEGGYLAQYQEEVDDQPTSGTAIVARISYEYSVNPRLLLALLEYQSGWVTRKDIDPNQDDYPMAYPDSNRPGLYRQLAWAANNLNRGFYLWQVNALPSVVLPDGSVVPLAATINAGTAGVQYLMSLLYNRSGWDSAVSESGVYAVYNNFFGYPFDLAVEPLLPEGLSQPAMQLPLEAGPSWSFTGGPHAGWGDGSAWAALDFAPPGEGQGCVQSDAWVTAVADGLVIRSGNGVVVLDLDGDGLEQTGWTVLYLHIETRDRVALGTQVKAGDRIGHPSCEGGLSNGTHFHMARRYNGMWISADGTLPFNLDGWISAGTSIEYNGTLTRNGQVVEAWDRRVDENQISR
ncbi:membrane proteins related to metalloendopeptidases [Longilinea arvoryzae]|uniref:Membrane proteins related to metalloendopeptidases n=1 Tax=Longilinea arvoryzae TaxID=360412 RepID=A0A0S7BG84_9CHLR|nr:LysM peptidoglycan-binding domain-containing protein [Longilinea arvoryzae]GAP14128.1 membrane proteins related to metalloendopeptidases [Longilinea arvoryzae]